VEKYEITRIYSGKEEKVVDLIAQEVPLTIYVNDKEIVTLLASPGELTELAVGFLFTSGFIKSFDQIEKITQDNQRWSVSVQLKDRQFDTDLGFKRMVTSGCGRGTLFYKAVGLIQRSKSTSKIAIHRDQVFRLMTDFQSRSIGFKQTGGVHSAALADGDNIIVVREDIGRHNAVDKVLGFSLMNNIALGDKIILSSGRVSSEIVLKILKTKICLIISRSAPTNQAINHAKDSGITLIGFARGRRMNVYNERSRIL